MLIGKEVLKSHAPLNGINLSTTYDDGKLPLFVEEVKIPKRASKRRKKITHPEKPKKLIKRVLPKIYIRDEIKIKYLKKFRDENISVGDMKIIWHVELMKECFITYFNQYNSNSLEDKLDYEGIFLSLLLK